MSSKLFVGGLAWGTDNDSLRAAFAPMGEVVEAVVITDRETGRSRGFGFVTMASEELAKAAVARMDGTSLDGRTIRVNEAEERAGGGGGRPGGGGGGGGGPRGPGGPRRDGPGRPPMGGRPPFADSRGPRPPGGGGGMRRPDDRGPGGGGAGWGGGAPATEEAGWGEDDSRRSKRSRKWEDKPGVRREEGVRDDFGDRDRGAGKGKRRAWDDWDDD